MHLCQRCNAAVDAGRSHCPICDQPVAPPPDATWVGPSPATPAAGTPPAPGYGPPPAYGVPPMPPPYPVAPGYGGMAPVGPWAAPPKSKAAAAVLCFFLGSLGIHRFYTGQNGLGVALLVTSLVLGPLTCGLWYAVTLVWVLVDFVLILTGGVDDQWGRPLV